MRIDYYSTVSGGGLAAGLYLETLKRYLDNGGDLLLKGFKYADAFERERPNCKGAEATLRRHLERGYHDNILDGLASPKVWFSNYDRGDSIERELDDTILGRECTNQTESLTLSAFFVPRDIATSPVLPMWVTNATVFQNGWMFPFAPNVIEAHRIDGFTHRLQRVDAQLPAQIAYAMPAAVGLKASASFPLVIPSSTLPSQACQPHIGPQRGCNLQLMDGGLSDNTGVITALQLLAGENADQPTRKLLIVVDAFPGDLTPHSRNFGSPSLLQVLTRVTEINKDAFRQLVRHYYGMFAQKANIRVLYLTIDDLDFLREIGTNFNITKKQQTALLACGMRLIQDQQSFIDNWLAGRDRGVGLVEPPVKTECREYLTGAVTPVALAKK